MLLQPCVCRSDALLPNISGRKHMCTSTAQPSIQFRSQLPFVTFYVPSKVTNLRDECRVVFCIKFCAMGHMKHVLEILQLIGWRNEVVAWWLCDVSDKWLWCMQWLQRPSPGLRAWVEWRYRVGACLLTPLSRVLLEKLTGFQLVKKFPEFCGTLLLLH
jgi:hypothetical protein